MSHPVRRWNAVPPQAHEVGDYVLYHEHIEALEEARRETYQVREFLVLLANALSENIAASKKIWHSEKAGVETRECARTIVDRSRAALTVIPRDFLRGVPL